MGGTTAAAAAAAVNLNVRRGRDRGIWVVLAEGSDVDRSGFLVPLGSSSLGFWDSFGFFLSSGSLGTALFGFFVGLFGQFMGCVMMSHPSSF